ncbi:HAD family hydrolase [Konateibacter massiliensis]|uniref:HAD family hydrolase n=1 Tax=Konateibacter massiliensis TaxID=2002841 RepID=UPI000C147AE7|nr:HAD hydrolase-like protein [Konateibacter massiliensis]
MIKLIAFDLDGTICDSLSLCTHAFRKAVSPYAGHELSDEEIFRTFGLNETGMIKAIIEKNWEDALQDFYTYYEEFHYMCTSCFSGIPELIGFLKEKGITVSLITGKGEKSCHMTLQKLELDNAFSDVLCGNDHAHNKAENMQLLIDKYALAKDEFLYIGDAITDVTACKSIGITCLSAAWQEVSNVENLRLENSPYVFESVEDVREFLAERLSSDI